MDIWAIADLHLAISVPEKTMEIFGPRWANYMSRIEEQWCALVAEEDLVLIAGDITWALALEDARKDLEWIDRLPGTKVLIKGNHDYWWSSLSKLKKVLPPSIHLIQNNAFQWEGISIAGTRLWDTEEFCFFTPKTPFTERELAESQKIYVRELERLELSLKELKQKSTLRIAMTHYPPIGPNLAPSKASTLLEKYNVDLCVFGHLHVAPHSLSFGKAGPITYHLVSADFLNCTPLKIYTL